MDGPDIRSPRRQAGFIQKALRNDLIIKLEDQEALKGNGLT